jgi:hypothetical protein
MNIEEEISASLAEQIAKEIDNEILDTIMISLLTKEGWTATNIGPEQSLLSPKHVWYTDTAEWLHLNATGDYKLLRGKWLFERQEDAVMFVLRWS